MIILEDPEDNGNKITIKGNIVLIGGLVAICPFEVIKLMIV